MGRSGLLPDEAPSFIDTLRQLPGLKLEGVFTHFAVADLADKDYTRQQFAAYLEIVAALEREGIEVPIRHVANSAATLDLPDMHLVGNIPSDHPRYMQLKEYDLSLRIHPGDCAHNILVVCIILLKHLYTDVGHFYHMIYLRKIDQIIFIMIKNGID